MDEQTTLTVFLIIRTFMQNGNDAVSIMLTIFLFVCFVCPEQTAIISLYNIN